MWGGNKVELRVGKLRELIKVAIGGLFFLTNSYIYWNTMHVWHTHEREKIIDAT